MTSPCSPIAAKDSFQSLFKNIHDILDSPISPRPISPVLKTHEPIPAPMNSTNGGGGGGGGEHVCTECATQFGSARMLSLHVRVAHQRGSLWHCTHCSSLFGCSRQLSDHILSCHRNGPHNCRQCTATFASPILLRQHEEAHEAIAAERALHRCTQCHFASRSLGELRFHQFDKHSRNAAAQRRVLLLPAPTPRGKALPPTQPRLRMESVAIINSSSAKKRKMNATNNGNTNGFERNDAVIVVEPNDDFVQKENSTRVEVGKPMQVPERVTPMGVLQMRNWQT